MKSRTTIPTGKTRARLNERPGHKSGRQSFYIYTISTE